MPFRELYPSNPEFQTRILPAVRHMVVPIMETPEGEIIQDTTDMIECLEARFPQPLMVPDTPVQRAVAWLLGAFGSEGLLQPGMSYRWSYRAEQEDFLRCRVRPHHVLRARSRGPLRAPAGSSWTTSTIFCRSWA